MTFYNDSLNIFANTKHFTTMAASVSLDLHDHYMKHKNEQQK